MTDLELRIERLERENRVFRLCGGAAVCVVALFLLSGSTRR